SVKDCSIEDSSSTPKFLNCLSVSLSFPIPESISIFFPSTCNRIGSVLNSIKLFSVWGYLRLQRALGTTPNIAPPSKKLTPPLNHVREARPTCNFSIFIPPIKISLKHTNNFCKHMPKAKQTNSREQNSG